MDFKTIDEQVYEMPVKSFSFSNKKNEKHEKYEIGSGGVKGHPDGETSFMTFYAVIEGDFPGDGKIYDHKKFQELLNEIVESSGVEFNSGVGELVEEEKGWMIDSISANLIALSIVGSNYFAKINVEIEMRMERTETDLAEEAADERARFREE